MVGSRRLTQLIGLVHRSAKFPSAPLLVALSGGADSAVAGWAACQHTESVRGIYLHHGQTGSDRLQQAAERVAQKLGIDLISRTLHVSSGASPEGQARLARYQVLRDELGEQEWLVTGHTRSDQAETVLGRLLRGSGPSGLSGMSRCYHPRNHRLDETVDLEGKLSGLPSRICRPLMEVERGEIRELAVLLGLEFEDDPTNLDLRIQRNRLRTRLLPLLETHCNPRVIRNLAGLADRFGAEEQEWEERLDRLPFQTGAWAARIPLGNLQISPRPDQRRIIRRLCRWAGFVYPPTSAHTEQVLDNLTQERVWELGGGIKLWVGSVWVEVSSADTRPTLDPITIDLDMILAGKKYRWGEWLIEMVPITSGYFPSFSPWRMRLTADDYPLEILPADPHHKIGIGNGSKSVKAALAEAGVVWWERPTWPAVCNKERVIWLPGVRQEPTLTSCPESDYHILQIMRVSRWKTLTS